MSRVNPRQSLARWCSSRRQHQRIQSSHSSCRTPSQMRLCRREATSRPHCGRQLWHRPNLPRMFFQFGTGNIWNSATRGRSIDPENEKRFLNDSHLPIFENSGTKCPGKWWMQRPSRFGPSVPRNETQIAEMRPGPGHAGTDKQRVGQPQYHFGSCWIWWCTKTERYTSSRAPPFSLISPLSKICLPGPQMGKN